VLVLILLVVLDLFDPTRPSGQIEDEDDDDHEDDQEPRPALSPLSGAKLWRAGEPAEECLEQARSGEPPPARAGVLLGPLECEDEGHPARWNGDDAPHCVARLAEAV